jgi:hypothetical protein
MAIIKLFDHKNLFLAFRDTVANVLKNDLSITLKPRRLDEVAAHLAGAKDFNTALGLIECTDEVPVNVQALIKALEIVKRSRDYMAEMGEYPKALLHELGSDQLIDDFLADVAEQALTGQACTLELSVFDLPEVSQERGSYLPASPANHIVAPKDCLADYRKGWELANKMSCEGRLDLTTGAPLSLTNGESVGFWHRQVIDKKLLDAAKNDQLQIIDLIKVNVTQVDGQYAWGSLPCRRASSSSFATHAEAQADAYDSLGVNWFCSPHEKRRLAEEGITVGFVHGAKKGYAIRVMGIESVEENCPNLTDEQVWELVTAKARKQGAESLYQRLLDWMEKVSPDERYRMRVHTLSHTRY